MLHLLSSTSSPHEYRRILTERNTSGHVCSPEDQKVTDGIGKGRDFCTCDVYLKESE